MGDWKDALASLRDSGDLPEPDASSANEDIHDESPAEKTAGDVIHIVFEKKGRKGKSATIAEGFTCSDEELAALASRLKQRLATGGSARGGEILIQGDCRDRLARALRQDGYKVK